jgi:hypothetical protein
MDYTRRSFVKSAGMAAGAIVSSGASGLLPRTIPEAEILNPSNRVPVSLIIDDSTCLVNMAHFGIPQFGEVFPDQYRQDWRKLPREIPDSFVREFGEWSRENGIKGKYSIVPFPACTGWVDRFIPGWTKRELEASLALVRDLITPNWDIHPEMVSHTRVIDIRTGKPFPYPAAEFMENWEWSQTKSAEELAAYQVYALNILKQAGLQCEGLTTPGGYGTRNQDNFARATLQAVQEVYGTQLVHFFRDLFTEKGKSVKPVVLLPSDLNGPDPKCVVSLVGCTDDWFGGWDGLTPGNADKLISADLLSGRMVEVINSNEPAIMVCHWPGIYFNGDRTGFKILKEVVNRLNQKYDNLQWMKLNEIARYWAARELTSMEADRNQVVMKAPFAASDFTVKLNFSVRNAALRSDGDGTRPLVRVKDRKSIKSHCWYTEKGATIICFDLKKGTSTIDLTP